jgi:predicted Ser/Thr protein kinase
VDPELEARLARFVERHAVDGTCLPVEELCADRPDLVASLATLVSEYLSLARTLGPPGGVTTPSRFALRRPRTLAPSAHEPGLPSFDGFRTVERLGAGGMGEVFKLQDLTLDRVVAAKVVRRDRRQQVQSFLEEARALALFDDPHIVRIHEFRADADPPVIIMELVEGFELGQVAPSLEWRQRARLVEEVCHAVQHAHDLGVQHRDLKPSNIMVDARLRPRILDFGLSAGDPHRGHLVGTLPYLAPEQLDPGLPIDARTDVYALGVVLYELLSGQVPYTAATRTDAIAAIRAGQPRLPVEINPAVPEPLQAIALKAMERDPAARYASARDLAADLARYREGRPVLARPSHYASALGTRIRPHLQQIDEWQQIRLIYPHEAARLRTAYHALEARDDDWIVASRVLSPSQIALYLGAFLLLGGSLLYFGAHRFHEAVKGVWQPFLVLGLPFLGLNAAGQYLYRRERRAVAVAFYLGGVALLPLFLLIFFHERGIFLTAANAPVQIFEDAVSNRQLQVTIFLACAWTALLAFRTRTAAFSTAFTVLCLLLALAILGDFGLRTWLEERRWDALALHLAPLGAVYLACGYPLERTRRPWFARPLYIGSALLLMAVLDLLALNGRQFDYLGLSAAMQAFQPVTVSDPHLLDTLAAMTANGVIFYVAASIAERRGSELMRATSGLLYTLSPFAALKPLGWLCQAGEYSYTFDWLYLALALSVAWLSHYRQRKSFYYAGLMNIGWALWIITDHQDWFDKPLWAIAIVAIGLATLAAGFGLEGRDRRRR